MCQRLGLSDSHEDDLDRGVAHKQIFQDDEEEVFVDPSFVDFIYNNMRYPSQIACFEQGFGFGGKCFR